MHPELAQRIGAEVERIPILDSHEHIWAEEERLAQEIDLSHFLTHYASSDLVFAGMDLDALQDLRGSKVSPEDKWRLFDPRWGYARHTGYGRIDVGTIGCSSLMIAATPSSPSHRATLEA